MKRIYTTIISCLLAVECYSAGTDSAIRAHEQGPKTSATLTNIIAQAGAIPRRLDVDAGRWIMTTNVIVPTNLSLYIYPGSSIHSTNGSTLTINGPLLSGPWEIFTGTNIIVNGSPIGLGITYQEWGSNNLTTQAVKDLKSTSLTVQNFNLTPATGAVTFTFTTNMTRSQIQSVIDSAPHFLPSDTSQTYQFEDGDYNFGAIFWFNFTGEGLITIIGNAADAPATNMSVRIIATNPPIGSAGIEIGAVEPIVRVQHLYILGDAIGPGPTIALKVTGENVEVDSCYLDVGVTATNQNFGQAFQSTGPRSGGKIENSIVSGGSAGIALFNGAHIFSESNFTGSVTSFYGSWASSSIIFQSEGLTTNQPIGVNATNARTGGGQIFSGENFQ